MEPLTSLYHMGGHNMNYLNTKIAETLFKEARNSEIYVDKSLLIEKVSKHIRTKNKYICITRPRRFGKTTNATMLGAYFTKTANTHPLFDDLEIAGRECYKTHLNQHNVIYIDFSRMPDNCRCFHDYINDIIEGIKDDLSEAYPKLQKKSFSSLSKLLIATNDSFIFILDEWDSVFCKNFMKKDDKNSFFEFLKGLFKDQPYAELVYMTGILPIAKYSSGSELNMFDEFHFINDNVFDLYFGFYEQEVQKLCKLHPVISYEEMKAWYDGYYTSDGRSLFNPRSVCKALERGICLNYWTETGPMNEIADCIEYNVDEVREDIVKMVAGIQIEVELMGYSAAEQQMNTRDEILSAMTVYGFLSYHDGFLKIPNHELMEKYHKVLHRDSMGAIKDIVNRSKEMLTATLECDETKVAEILEYVHDREIPFLNYADENSLSCVITLCYLTARKDYIIEREMASGKGFCDYLFLPKKQKKPAIVMELKYGSTAKAAIQQIKDKNYMQKIDNYNEILLVGINYDKTKHHSCLIEHITKAQL